MEPPDRMLKWFNATIYEEAPDLQRVAEPFRNLALVLVASLLSGPERTVALRKLLEAKEAAIRAALYPGE